eukprot:gene7500-15348_t
MEDHYNNDYLEESHSVICLMQRGKHEEKIRSVENILIRLDDSENIESSEFIIRLIISDIRSSWILKFKISGIIINDIDLILSDAISFDATITFKSINHFMAIITNPESIKSPENSSNITQEGSKSALDYFWTRINSLSNGFIKSPKKTSASSGDSSQPIRSGWLLKKRDIISAWRCRYFSVYPGRLEYFIGPQDIIPRGVIHLHNAEIIGPKRCNVNGVPDHWCLQVEPRMRGNERGFRLASENVGEGGMTDAQTWITALKLAANCLDTTSTPTSGTTPGASNPLNSPPLSSSSNHNHNHNRVLSNVRNIFEQTKAFVHKQKDPNHNNNINNNNLRAITSPNESHNSNSNYRRKRLDMDTVSGGEEEISVKSKVHMNIPEISEDIYISNFNTRQLTSSSSSMPYDDGDITTYVMYIAGILAIFGGYYTGGFIGVFLWLVILALLNFTTLRAILKKYFLQKID